MSCDNCWDAGNGYIALCNKHKKKPKKSKKPDDRCYLADEEGDFRQLIVFSEYSIEELKYLKKKLSKYLEYWK